MPLQHEQRGQQQQLEPLHQLRQMLPTDIILIIVENTGDLETLKAWSLVCRSTNRAAELLLWRTVTIPDIDLITLALNPDGLILSEPPINPAYILDKEKCADPEHKHVHRRPVRIRGPLVKRLVVEDPLDFREIERVHGPWHADGHYKLRKILPPLKNLQTFELDGEILERTWTDLLNIPSLRNLRIRRRTEMVRYPPFLDNVISETRDPAFISFHGLSQLRRFEIGKLLFEEGFALGTQVRNSSLETLHISACAGTVNDPANTHASPIAEFFRGLGDVSTFAGNASDSISGRNYGFPSSLRDLAIEDARWDFITTSESLTPALSACKNLTSLHLDTLDNTCLGHILDRLHLPHLATLTLPLIGTDLQSVDLFRSIGPRISRLASMLQRHRTTLQKFTLLDCWGEAEICTRDLSHTLGNWLTIREIRLDASLLDDYDFEDAMEREEVHDWTTTSSMLSSDGSRIWGCRFHRLRLDRVSLHTLNLDGTRCWKELKVLVLNPKLRWHFSLVAPEEGEPWDVHDSERRRKHILGVKPGGYSEAAAMTERYIALRIAQMQSPSPVRLVAVGQQRFWLQRRKSGAFEKLWWLADALADSEQAREMKEHLTKLDWDFLAERTTGNTARRGNTAVFMRSDHRVSEPDSDEEASV